MLPSPDIAVVFLLFTGGWMHVGAHSVLLAWFLPFLLGCAGKANHSLPTQVPGVPCGDPLLLQLALIEHRSQHRTALTVTERRNLFSEA